MQRLTPTILLTLALPLLARAQPGCANCHREIAATYARTGMARSFYRPTNNQEHTGAYYHKPSESYFQMLERDGKLYQRRYQKAPDGAEINVMEMQVDYIMGSGNHARAYLNRTSRNTLVELPLAWYAEKGGYWGMNPGYDRPHHEGFRRAITYDCMFCHNAYPAIPAGNEQPLSEPIYAGSLPEGIDCQRCHGPGARHMQVAKTAGVSKEDIRNSIVNPARLSAQRQMEVCMQCHLETTSFPLPNTIQRYDRGPFSYKPGEPLDQFMLAFDHAPGSGREGKFEIVSAAYRLRQSACFLQSKGKLACTTCHNPHDIPHGEKAAQHYSAVCRQCHNSALDQLVASGKHTAASGCVDCHMPKRRTEDVVHAVLTDHYIQRRKPVRDLLADLPERHESDGDYQGEVVPYYPKPLPPSPENDLYLAIAQVIQRSNLKAGIAQLTRAIERYRPARAEFYFQLAEAWRNDGQLEKSLPLYREAIRRNPSFVFAMEQLGSVLRRTGNYAQAEDVLKRAASVDPNNPATWRDLGLTYQAQAKSQDAAAALQKAVQLDPGMSEAFNNLGVIWASSGQRDQADSAFREAIRIQPDYADAHNNLAMALGQERRFEEAQTELEAAIQADPNQANAHELLADLLLAKNQLTAALTHYREALRIQPDFGRAHLGLGIALAATGDVPAAIPHLQRAASDPDPAVREEASQNLRQLGH